MKKVLIISPFFPPTNAADMQRVRTSLPYFKEFGWIASVVTVDAIYSGMVADKLLLESIPGDIEIHVVKALDKKITTKFGFGSLGLRALWHLRSKVNQVLAAEHYDLLYFSTTQFPVCALGAYWGKKFGTPYVIDMQDPWYSDHYDNKPKEQRPPKYRIVYGLHKRLEAKAMMAVDGLISVSDYYILDLKARYLALKAVPSSTITFGAFEPDIKIASAHSSQYNSLLNPDYVNIVYIGRGGNDMHEAIKPVFAALKQGLDEHPHKFDRLKFWFIGTSYAPPGQGTQTILPLARAFGVEQNVMEITERIGYYHSLAVLGQADALFIPGSDDPKYSASKIFPYLLLKKPLLALFNKDSNAVKILNDCALDGVILTFGKEETASVEIIYNTLLDWASRIFLPIRLSKAFGMYSARNLTGRQTELFDRAIKYHETKNTNA